MSKDMIMKKLETKLKLNRDVYFVEYDESIDWRKTLPDGNWSLTVIADKPDPKIKDLIRIAIDNNTGYICGVGKEQGFVELIADSEIVERKITGAYLPGHLIFTVGDEEFEDGIWYSLYLTHNGDTEIKKIVFVDFTGKAYPKFIELIGKLENGYLPPDSDL